MAGQQAAHLNEGVGTVKAGLLRAADHVTQATEDQVAGLLEPDEGRIGTLRVKLGDGSVTAAGAYRFGFGSWRGMFAGGTRFHPDVTGPEVEELALGMVAKYMLTGLPYAGAKTGVSLSLKGLSEEDERKVLREFVRLMDPMLGPFTGRLGPDVGVTPRHIDMMVDAWRELHGITEGRPEEWLAARLVATGKSEGNAGIAGRGPATGYGVGVAMLDVAKRYGIDLLDGTVAIQGWGNVGQHLATYLARQGVRVVAVANRTAGAVFRGEGFDVGALRRHTAHEGAGALATFPGVDRISAAEWLELEVDGLALCALGGAVDADNAVRIRASLVAEGANFPITDEADPILDEMGCRRAEFQWASTGGIVGSHCERLANLTQEPWPTPRVLREVEERIRNASAVVHSAATETRLSSREAANVVALTKMVEAARQAGKI
jgi:glutamate dehydrogenase (NAD(P)+)